MEKLYKGENLFNLIVISINIDKNVDGVLSGYFRLNYHDYYFLRLFRNFLIALCGKKLFIVL